MNDATETRLRQMVEDSNADFSDAVEAFEESMETLESNLMEEMEQDEKEERALQFMTASNLEQDRTAYGESLDLQVLAIGARSMQWSNGKGGKKDVVIAYGLIHTPNGRLPAKDGNNGPDVGLSVFILDSSKGVDPTDAMEKFDSLNTLTGTFSVSRSSEISQVGNSDLYRCEATSRTVIEHADEEALSLPTERGAKNDILRSRIPEASLFDAATDAATVLSELGEPTDDGRQFPAEFGGDLRRINANIVDYYIADDQSWGRYTVLDDSVVDEDLVDSPLMGDSQQTPGLTAWADPRYHINYGRKSQVDLYCYLESDDDGQVQANVVGIVPILPMPLDDEDAASSAGNATETSI